MPSPSRPPTRTLSARTRTAGGSRLRLAAVALAAITATTACLPAAPATGRPGPIRKVEVLGDSLTYGLFGTTPGVESALRSRLAKSGISLTIDGGPGDTIPTPWAGQANWADELQARIDRDDPDVVIIQSVLFVDAENPANQAAYRTAATRLLDIAQSRGAHVYFVHHHRPTDATERRAAEIAEAIQADVATGRGVEFVALDWWLGRCEKPFVKDGWHLSANGERCWADAANAAVNQLRNAVG